MENVVLTVHLILALLLTGVVLLQRSEGGGLGMGGGSGGGVMSGRQAANWMTKVTWGLGIALFATSLSLTVIAARQSSNSSIMDQIGARESEQDSGLPSMPEYTPPPSTGGDPLVPPSPDASSAGTAPATDGQATQDDAATGEEAAAGGEAAQAASEVVAPPASPGEGDDSNAPAEQQPAN